MVDLIIRSDRVVTPLGVAAHDILISGGKIAALFDGTEKVVSWDVFPWYIRTVSTP